MPLITKTDIAARRQLANSVQDVVINQFIEDSEFEDIRPLLGDIFYNDIVANTGNYSDLLNGSTYEHQGNTFSHPGIKKVLVDFTYSRYVMFGSQTDTPFGFVEKQNSDSQQLGRDARKERYKSLQQSATMLWQEVNKFLDRNASDYPLWNQSNISTLGTFRISKISN